jgi:hypothetical protein
MVFVNDIYTDEHQSMADIISRAREARRIWLTFSAEN